MASNVVEGNHEMFECQVCLEEMTKKKPRLLPCGHSFCSSCLNEILRPEGFRCPTCRFKVDETDINRIPVNFNILKMKEIESDILKMALQNDLCKFCLLKGKKTTAIVKCTDCDRNMCDDCCSKHETLSAFKGHQVILLSRTSKSNCKKHGQNINFFCSECEMALCVDCTFDTEHSTHENKIKDFSNGLDENRKKMQTVCEDAQRMGQTFEVDCIDVTRKVKSQITNRLRVIQNQAQQEHDDLMKQLPNEEELTKIHTALGKSQKDLSALIKAHDTDYINSVGTVYGEVTSSMTLAEKYHKYLHKLVFQKSNIDNVLLGVLQAESPFGSIATKTLETPELLLSLDCAGFGIVRPSEIYLTEDLIFISDHSHHIVKMFSIDGHLMDEFKVNASYGNINGVASSGKELYVGHDYAVTVIPFKSFLVKKKVYRPNVQCVACVTVVKPMVVLIADAYSGTVVKFDCSSQKTEQVCRGLKYPNSIAFAHNICTVVDYGTNTVNVYDSSFRPICVITGDGNFDPRSSSILPSGNLLVSVNQRHSICEYNQSGKLIQCVMTRKDGIEYPRHIKYKNGKLVVIERTEARRHVAVKLFSLK